MWWWMAKGTTAWACTFALTQGAQTPVDFEAAEAEVPPEAPLVEVGEVARFETKGGPWVVDTCSGHGQYTLTLGPSDTEPLPDDQVGFVLAEAEIDDALFGTIDDPRLFTAEGGVWERLFDDADPHEAFEDVVFVYAVDLEGGAISEPTEVAVSHPGLPRGCDQGAGHGGWTLMGWAALALVARRRQASASTHA